MTNNTPAVLGSSTKSLFSESFQGSNLSHGVLTVKADGKTFEHLTKQCAALPEDYEAHLVGKTGLGIGPVREDATCRFGAIDVDVDTINHRQLFDRVTELRMPLSVCRSKSGGAHLYLFVKEPGIKASKIQTTLRRWAGLLGFPKAEIFPKQTHVDANNLGNWINLPYFGGNNSTRYAVGLDGSLLLEEFLDSIQWWNGEDEVQSNPLVVLNNSQMPPCLEYLAAHPLEKGQRNEGLFNFGVYFRKSDPGNWKERLHEQNGKLSEPLDKGEIGNLKRSLDRVKYQYRCSQEPIVSHCDRKTCLSRTFGIQHMPWQEEGSFDAFQVTKIQKTTETVPRYILNINGTHELTVTCKEVLNFERLSEAAFLELNLVIAPKKRDQWRSELHELMKTMESVEGDRETSEDQVILDSADDFFIRYKFARNSEEAILRGDPILEAATQEILFQKEYLHRFLVLHKRLQLSSPDLVKVLRKAGFKDARREICGKKVRVWKIPLSALNIQTTDFTDVSFGKPCATVDQTVEDLEILRKQIGQPN